MADGYDVTAIYPYTSMEGDVLYSRARFDHPTEVKTVRPIHRTAEGVLVAKEPDEIRNGLKPLYGLHFLRESERAHAWIVEGEKCANDMNAHFYRCGMIAEHIALTSGSATSAEKADWQPLEGRSVTIWADNDISGLKYAAAVTTALEALGCTVDCIAVGELGLGDGEDCVEWFEANPTATIADILALPIQQPAPPDNEMRIICMSDVEMRPINWLWEKRIACGKLTVIAGDAGLGKSQLTANLAATVSQGLMWPEDGLPNCSQGHVVFLSAEDDAADTIKPRLIAAGADVSKCHIIEAIRTKTKDGRDSERSFDLSQDVERLGMALGQIGDVRLVIIDPITAYLGDTDSHNNAEIRGVLAPLSAMAASHGAAILLITHLNKSTGHNILARVIGSTGMPAAARACYLVSKDPNEPELRYFLPIKNNVGNDSDGFSYRIDGFEIGDGINTSRIVWQHGKVNAHAILNPAPEEKPVPTNKAQDWLKDLLSEPMLSNDIYTEAEGAGFSKGKLFRAAEALEVQKKKLGMKGSWQWSLPKRDAYGNIIKATEDAKECEDSTYLEMAPLESELQSS
ncbi:MAG: AAA family ATPase [Rickettsiales bacterium]